MYIILHSLCCEVIVFIYLHVAHEISILRVDEIIIEFCCLGNAVVRDITIMHKETDWVAP